MSRFRCVPAYYGIEASTLANVGQTHGEDNAPVPEHVCDDFASRLQLSLQFLKQPGHAFW